MYKNEVKIDGMMCGMCESHIADELRKAFPDAKKIKASRRKNNAVFQTAEPVDPQVVQDVIEKTGYHYMGFSSAEK